MNARSRAEIETRFSEKTADCHCDLLTKTNNEGKPYGTTTTILFLELIIGMATTTTTTTILIKNGNKNQ